MKLKDKTAVITGAGSGIGRAIALGFAAEGARVVIGELDEASGSETARMASSRGAESFAAVTDVSSPESVAALFKAIDDRGWGVDILVNNAGSGGELTPVHLMTDEVWQTMLDVHLNGTFYCTREALNRMIQRGTGVIISIGSVAGLRGFPGAANYTAAKAAIIAFTKAVAQEVAPAGIRVNCIAPGWIDTPILNNLPEEMRSQMTQMTPLGRIGSPDEVASVALFLASDDSSYVTGQTISPNGGLQT
ncbi:MAG TPA: SDR family NAD(P)-dependent oxidoreductase [Blastocatellia bacterium]|jgi:NAD(P)-dependent dehydrogenase (short-subunit alcohol dehydrogenase family)